MRGLFPFLDGQQVRYPKGDDLRGRVKQAIKEFVVPIIRDVTKEEKGDNAKEKDNV